MCGQKQKMSNILQDGTVQFKEKVTWILNQKGLHLHHLKTHLRMPAKRWMIFGPCQETSKNSHHVEPRVKLHFFFLFLWRQVIDRRGIMPWSGSPFREGHGVSWPFEDPLPPTSQASSPDLRVGTFFPIAPSSLAHCVPSERWDQRGVHGDLCAMEQWQTVRDNLQSSGVNVVQRKQVRVPHQHVCCDRGSGFDTRDPQRSPKRSLDGPEPPPPRNGGGLRRQGDGEREDGGSGSQKRRRIGARENRGVDPWHWGGKCKGHSTTGLLEIWTWLVRTRRVVV